MSPSSTIAEDFLPIIKLAHAYGFTIQDEHNLGRQTDPCRLYRYSMEANPLDTIKHWLDGYINGDKCITLYGHAANLGNAYGGETWDIAKLKAVIEYALSKRDSGQCYIGSPDECVKYFFGL